MSSALFPSSFALKFKALIFDFNSFIKFSKSSELKSFKEDISELWLSSNNSCATFCKSYVTSQFLSS